MGCLHTRGSDLPSSMGLGDTGTGCLVLEPGHHLSGLDRIALAAE